MDSILTSIKKLLGMTKEYNAFDQDIIMHINAVFMTLRQLGVGPIQGFRIEDATATWNQFIDPQNDPEKQALLSAVKTYIHIKVKLVFDPPLSSAVIKVLEDAANELEWRLNVEAESE